jgi:hypothetical protein
MKVLTGAFVLVAVIAVAWLLLFGSGPIRDSRMIHRGNAIVAKLEAFRVSNGHYPQHLDEIGIPETESGPFFYERRDHDFHLWYGKRLGESMTYKSDSKTWNDEH